jgi:hypothetical protein
VQHAQTPVQQHIDRSRMIPVTTGNPVKVIEFKIAEITTIYNTKRKPV